MKSNIFLLILLANCFQLLGQTYFKVLAVQGNCTVGTNALITDTSILNHKQSVTLAQGAYLALIPQKGKMIEFTKPGKYVLANYRPLPADTINNFATKFDLSLIETPVELNDFSTKLNNIERIGASNCNNSVYSFLMPAEDSKNKLFLVSTSIAIIGLDLKTKAKFNKQVSVKNMFEEKVLDLNTINGELILDVTKFDKNESDNFKSEYIIDLGMDNSNKYLIEFIQNGNPLGQYPQKEYTAADYVFLGNYFSRQGHFLQARSCFYFAYLLQPSVLSYQQRYLDMLYDHIGSEGKNRYGRRKFDYPIMRKPVIYLYPTTETKVDLKLEYQGNLTFTYPKYNKGWSVKAKPNGDLMNIEDSSMHSYLFWEGVSNKHFSPILSNNKGFLVEGYKTVEFLTKKLKQIGLTAKEYNDFIVYWAPILEKNRFNFVYFAINNDYNYWVTKLNVNPVPDSQIRVFMFYKPIAEPMHVNEQPLPKLTRNGFTLVEWGGTELPEY